LLMILLSAMACSLPGGTAIVDPTPTAGVTLTPAVPVTPALTAELLRNATYPIEGCAGFQEYTLLNGSYTTGNDPLAPGYTAVSMGDLIAVGDLNYDEAADAAVILGVNCGGTGVFTYIVAVLNDAGRPMPAGAVFVDDRPLINSLVITGGEILAGILIHGPQDPMCCPALETQQGYRLYNSGTLVLTRLAKQTPGGSLRAINIGSILDLAEASFPLTVIGSTTIGPFENTLGYNVYAQNNSLVSSGSVMTDSPNPGDPGNFELTIDLSASGLTGLVRIEIVEYSMADGSVLALDSVLIGIP
jgi:hypothetical protein